MTRGKILFLGLILLLVGVLSYVKITKIKKAKAIANGTNKGGVKLVMVTGYVTEYSNISDVIKASGSILAQDEVILQPETSGRIVFLNIKEGTQVAKGSLLMKINDADLKAQMLKSTAQLKIAQANLARLAQLIAINGVAQAEYDAAENNVNNINADIELLKVQIAKTELRAPFTGKLGLRNISLGAYVSPNTQIVSLQNTSQLKMDVSVPEKYAGIIHLGDIMQFSVASIEGTFSAKVMAIEPNIDLLTRNLTVRALIQNPSPRLVPGAYTKVNLKLKDIPNAIMIPSNTIIPDDKTTRVVITDSSKAKFVDVEIGIRTSTEVQILKGLHYGDTVLTSGLLQVKPGMPVKITKVLN